MMVKFITTSEPDFIIKQYGSWPYTESIRHIAQAHRLDGLELAGSAPAQHEIYRTYTESLIKFKGTPVNLTKPSNGPIYIAVLHLRHMLRLNTVKKSSMKSFA